MLERSRPSDEEDGDDDVDDDELAEVEMSRRRGVVGESESEVAL